MHFKRIITGILVAALTFSSPVKAAPAGNETDSHDLNGDGIITDAESEAASEPFLDGDVSTCYTGPEAATDSDIALKSTLAAGSVKTAAISTPGKSDEETAQMLDISESQLNISLSNSTNDLQVLMNKIHKYNKANPASNAIFTVKLPKATYILGKKTGDMKGDRDCLEIFENTTLDLSEGATLKRNKSQRNYNMIRFGNYVNTNATNLDHISIVGGTIDNSYICIGMFRFAHAKDILFRNVTFLHGYDSHCIEFADCHRVLVDRCTFKDSAAKKNSYNKEAFQMEVMNKANFDGYPPYNNVQSSDVTIQNCLFDNCKSGIGTHKMTIGTYYNNIIIKNNTFRRLKRYAVYGLNWRNSKIINNKVKKCGGGFRFWSMIKSHNSNVYTTKKKHKVIMSSKSVISGNDINLTYNGWGGKNYENGFGIDVYGENLKKKHKHAPRGDYRIGKVTVKNNKIDSNLAVDGIRFTGTVNSKITKNKVVLHAKPNVNNHGIEMIKCWKITADHNTCSGGYNNLFASSSSRINIAYNNCRKASNGGFVAVKSKVGVVHHNKVTGSKQFGIAISKKSYANRIYNNNIQSSRKASFYFGKRAKVSRLYRNNIKKGRYGVLVKRAKVSRIYRNKINKCYRYGITYHKKYTKPKIYINKISGCGHHNKIKRK